MPRDSTATREQLLLAGEHLFARKGVDGALTREIIARAGQSNDSAVGYHFGSRRGLLGAILDRHMARIEQRQPPGPPPDDLPTLVDDLTRPVSEELRTADGRDFLRIIVQLAGSAGMRTHDLPNPLRGSAVAGQLQALERECVKTLPEPVALERLSLLISMLTVCLADRARRIDEAQLVLLDHDDFVANLVAMLTAALTAPVRRTLNHPDT
ncbi:TetR/AcrR family transcriptional regulator [Speluncibacter jeojiensis]|uniref:TetR/AcrR family transcriptional regulator n=1 Tax=Speluncibacter jeojiensis TaxID=2710754 RepID=UPI0024109B9D|nr:TetR family transcriptional regulator [Rhodococcus sp. D2-41]